MGFIELERSFWKEYGVLMTGGGHYHRDSRRFPFATAGFRRFYDGLGLTRIGETQNQTLTDSPGLSEAINVTARSTTPSQSAVPRRAL